VEMICGKELVEAWSERMKEWWMVKVVTVKMMSANRSKFEKG